MIMTSFYEYDTKRERLAILSAVDDLGIDYVDDCQDDDYCGSVTVDTDTTAESDYIYKALSQALIQQG